MTIFLGVIASLGMIGCLYGVAYNLIELVPSGAGTRLIEPAARRRAWSDVRVNSLFSAAGLCALGVAFGNAAISWAATVVILAIALLMAVLWYTSRKTASQSGRAEP